MNDLFGELKRRNIFRVAIAYVAVAWLFLQFADLVFENINAPDWVMQALMFLLAAGFPVTVLFAWAFEMTPDGIKREKDVDRSQSITHETGKKLNRMITGVLVVAVGFLLVDKFALRNDAPPVTAESTDKSVAVLPFVAMSRGEDDEYFADGLTEEILNSLTRVPELLVTARTSAFHFKGRDVPIPDVAAQLGVAHVVEGSVRRNGNKLRVTAQLIRAADGFHLWSETYDRNAEDTFGVQTDVAQKIASALGIFLDEETLDRMRAAGFRNPEAYIAFQKGRELYNDAHNTFDILPGLREANRWLDQVIEFGERSSTAHMMHADLYTHLLRDFYGTLGDEERDDAVEKLNADLEAAVANALDDETRLAASYDRALLLGNWQALPGLLKAYVEVAQCPQDVWGNTNSLEYGMAAEIRRLAELSMECDPQNPFGYWDAVQGNAWLGDFDAAIAVGELAEDIAPHSNTRRTLVHAYIAARRFDDVETLINRTAMRAENALEARLEVAAGRGDVETARKLLVQFNEVRAENPEFRLMATAIVGDRESADRIAAEIDALPYGYMSLMSVPSSCICGAPWDIEVTPNFKRMIDEAGFDWPPASPIEWPLKDW